VTLVQAAKAYKDNEELLRHYRMVWKFFGAKDNQVRVISVIEAKKPAKKPKQMSLLG